MKKEKFIILLIFLLLSTMIQAQEPFKGIITYESINKNYLKTKDTNKVWKSTIKIYVSDKNLRFDNIESRGTNEFFRYTWIKNLQDSSVISYIANNNKAALYHPKEKTDSLKNISKYQDGLELTFTNKTKRFLGYKCKKADYKRADGTKQGYVYYTTEIILPKEVNKYLNFDQIEGLVMQFSYPNSENSDNIFADYTANTIKEITNCDLDSNIFLVP